MTAQERINKNPVKPGDAKRGAKPRDPSGLYRKKRSVYLTDPEYAEFQDWLERVRLTPASK